MRLRDLIRTLECMPREALVRFDLTRTPPGDLHAWRTDPRDLTLTARTSAGDPPARTVAEVLVQLRAAEGAVFFGWKGDELRPTLDTEVWADAEDSQAGMQVVGVALVADDLVELALACLD